MSNIIQKIIRFIYGEIYPAKTLTEEEIREKAYLLWEEAGRPEGDGIEFWVRAERESKTL